MRSLGLIIAGLVVGLACGELLLETPAPATTAPVVVREPPAAQGLTAAEVRALLREELAARPVPAPPVAEPPTVAAAPEPSDELVEAQAHIEQALADRRWTEGDRAALRRSLATLEPAETDALLSAVFSAVNDGRLTIDPPGPIL